MSALLRLAAVPALVLALAAPGLAQAPAPALERSPHGQAAGEPAPPAPSPPPPPPPPAAAPREAGRPGGRPPVPEGRLPPDSVTRHSLELPDRPLSFEARAGSIPLTDPAGRPQADIAYVHYTLPGADPARRPVTFFLNGGPGAASAYLHIGAVGPWRLPLGERVIAPSASPVLVPNPETWLDFTDLVFVDPVGTGYSRLVNPTDELRNRFLSVEGDVEALADFIRRYLKQHGRLTSPVFFTGESYGGFRGPLVADKLQTDQGVGLSGLILLSPVLDFGWRTQPGYNPLPTVSLLPSLAAARAERAGRVDREALREVEAYASGEYVTDLLRGLQDPAAVERVSRRVTEITGLDPDLVRRHAGRIDLRTAQRELRRDEGRVVSLYDTGVSGYDPNPSGAAGRINDPGLEGMTAPLTRAIVDHLSRTLAWEVERDYQLLNGGVNGAWRWGRGRGQPEAMSELRSALALDPLLRVLVVHGFTDLVTPYFESELLLRQLPAFAEGRVRLEVYPGGHMFYNREASRQAFRQDAEDLVRRAIEARAAPEPRL